MRAEIDALVVAEVVEEEEEPAVAVEIAELVGSEMHQYQLMIAQSSTYRMWLVFELLMPISCLGCEAYHVVLQILVVVDLVNDVPQATILWSRVL